MPPKIRLTENWYLYYSAICWWVFTALTTTLRTLRLRRNKVKFGLYRHFTNVLIFSVIASVVFMLINIKLFKLEACLKGKARIYRILFLTQFKDPEDYSLNIVTLICFLIYWIDFRLA